MPLRARSEHCSHHSAPSNRRHPRFPSPGLAREARAIVATAVADAGAVVAVLLGRHSPRRLFLQHDGRRERPEHGEESPVGGEPLAGSWLAALPCGNAGAGREPRLQALQPVSHWRLCVDQTGDGAVRQPASEDLRRAAADAGVFLRRGDAGLCGALPHHDRSLDRAGGDSARVLLWQDAELRHLGQHGDHGRPVRLHAGLPRHGAVRAGRAIPAAVGEDMRGAAAGLACLRAAAGVSWRRCRRLPAGLVATRSFPHPPCQREWTWGGTSRRALAWQAADTGARRASLRRRRSGVQLRQRVHRVRRPTDVASAAFRGIGGEQNRANRCRHGRQDRRGLAKLPARSDRSRWPNAHSAHLCAVLAKRFRVRGTRRFGGAWLSARLGLRTLRSPPARGTGAPGVEHRRPQREDALGYAGLVWPLLGAADGPPHGSPSFRTHVLRWLAVDVVRPRPLARRQIPAALEPRCSGGRGADLHRLLLRRESASHRQRASRAAKRRVGGARRDPPRDAGQLHLLGRRPGHRSDDANDLRPESATTGTGDDRLLLALARCASTASTSPSTMHGKRRVRQGALRLLRHGATGSGPRPRSDVADPRQSVRVPLRWRRNRYRRGFLYAVAPLPLREDRR